MSTASLLLTDGQLVANEPWPSSAPPQHSIHVTEPPPPPAINPPCRRLHPALVLPHSSADKAARARAPKRRCEGTRRGKRRAQQPPEALSLTERPCKHHPVMSNRPTTHLKKRRHALNQRTAMPGRQRSILMNRETAIPQTPLKQKN